MTQLILYAEVPPLSRALGAAKGRTYMVLAIVPVISRLLTGDVLSLNELIEPKGFVIVIHPDRFVAVRTLQKEDLEAAKGHSAGIQKRVSQSRIPLETFEEIVDVAESAEQLRSSGTLVLAQCPRLLQALS